MLCLESFLRIVCTSGIVTAVSSGQLVAEDTPEFPADSQIFLRNYNGQFIVTAGVHQCFRSRLPPTCAGVDPSP